MNLKDKLSWLMRKFRSGANATLRGGSRFEKRLFGNGKKVSTLGKWGGRALGLLTAYSVAETLYQLFSSSDSVDSKKMDDAVKTALKKAGLDKDKDWDSVTEDELHALAMAIAEELGEPQMYDALLEAVEDRKAAHGGEAVGAGAAVIKEDADDVSLILGLKRFAQAFGCSESRAIEILSDLRHLLDADYGDLRTALAMIEAARR